MQQPNIFYFILSKWATVFFPPSILYRTARGLCSKCLHKQFSREGATERVKERKNENQSSGKLFANLNVSFRNKKNHRQYFDVVEHLTLYTTQSLRYTLEISYVWLVRKVVHNRKHTYIAFGWDFFLLQEKKKRNVKIPVYNYLQFSIH